MHKHKILGITGLATNLYSAYAGYMNAHHTDQNQLNTIYAASALICILLIAKTLYDLEQVNPAKKNLLSTRNKLFHLTRHLINEMNCLILIGANAATYNGIQHITRSGYKKS